MAGLVVSPFASGSAACEGGCFLVAWSGVAPPFGRRSGSGYSQRVRQHHPSRAWL